MSKNKLIKKKAWELAKVIAADVPHESFRFLDVPRLVRKQMVVGKRGSLGKGRLQAFMEQMSDACKMTPKIPGFPPDKKTDISDSIVFGFERKNTAVFVVLMNLELKGKRK